MGAVNTCQKVFQVHWMKDWRRWRQSKEKYFWHTLNSGDMPGSNGSCRQECQGECLLGALGITV